jgi:hypothetical protein
MDAVSLNYNVGHAISKTKPRTLVVPKKRLTLRDFETKILTQPILTFGLVGHLPVRVHGVGPGLDPLPLVRPLDTRLPHFFLLSLLSEMLMYEEGSPEGTPAPTSGGMGRRNGETFDDSPDVK